MNCQTNNGLIFPSPLPSPVLHDFFPSSFLSVLRKGQVVTNYYRWLQRRGGYLWIQSSATISINHKAPHERNVIWVNYIVRSVQPQPVLQSCWYELRFCMQAPCCVQRSFEGMADEMQRDYWKNFTHSNTWENWGYLIQIVTSKQSTLTAIWHFYINIKDNHFIF